MIVDIESKTIEIARTQIGVTEHPPGSNRGPEVDRYLASVGLDASKGAYAWCAAFVSHCVREAGKALNYTLRFKRSARALGLVQNNPDLILPAPIPGCIGVIDHGGGLGHTFFIYALDLTNPGTLFTLEGNSDAAGSRTGGSVVLRTRQAKDCCAFIQIA